MANALVKSLSFAILIASAAFSSAQVSFQSGNGAPNTQDSQVSFILGPSTADFATFTPSTFADFSMNATQAYILQPPLAGGWVSGLGNGSTAQWVGSSPTSGNNAYQSNTALYAISFTLAQDTPNAALNLIFSADDQLGGSNNVGLYLDGNAIANSSTGVLWDGTVLNQNYYLGSLLAGTHTLYLDDVNSGAGPAGVIFQGTVQSVPEPTSMAALAVGALGLIRRKYAKK